MSMIKLKFSFKKMKAVSFFFLTFIWNVFRALLLPNPGCGIGSTNLGLKTQIISLGSHTQD